MNPRKSPAIKAEIEKLLKAGFIYPVPLTEWVSNPIPVDKKQGAIRICTDLYDLNHAYPKDNLPTLHTFDGPRYPKNKKSLKKRDDDIITFFLGISCSWSSGVHQKYAVWVCVVCNIKFHIQRALPLRI